MEVIEGGYPKPSLAAVEEQLWAWEVPQTMWLCARNRGMPQDAFTVSYHQFVEYHYDKRNHQGEPHLGTIARAKYHGWKWLLGETDYPRVQRQRNPDTNAKDTRVKTKTGRYLKVYTSDPVP
jgi:hypothetical protein